MSVSASLVSPGRSFVLLWEGVLTPVRVVAVGFDSFLECQAVDLVSELGVALCLPLSEFCELAS